MKINQFKDRQRFSGPLLVTSLANGVAKSGAPYLSIVLSDNTGKIEAKMWELKEDYSWLKLGHIVELEADVIKYNTALQLKVHSLRIKDQKSYDLEQFVETSEFSKEELKQVIYQTIESIDNEILKKVVSALFEQYQSGFFIYPAAAKNHHNYIGGLATHTWEMVQLAEPIVKQYPFLNRNILMAGILVHDLCKIDEYQSPISGEYSTQGKLLGHISMAQAKVFEVATNLNLAQSEEVMLLRHMILSHHGQYEFGSPVLPLIPEAEILHLIDNISARMTMFNKTLSTTEAGEFSSRVFSLENRSLYKSNLSK